MRFTVALFICLACVTGLGVTAPAFAATQQNPSWDGTWVGNWDNGNGTQIVFAGDELIAFYWRGDYVSDVQASAADGGKAIAITWQSGKATLTRESETAARISIHENGQPDVSFALKRDN